MSTTITKTKDEITPELHDLIRDLNKLPQTAHKKAIELTPKKTGNARRRTRLTGTSIKGDYSYSGALDSGTSKQAPSGITKPLEHWINIEANKILGGK